MARVDRAHKTGAPEVMQLDEVQLPPPAAGQALVRIEAAGVNFIDIYHCSGTYPLPLPLAMGVEGAGIVEQVGPGVTDVRVGQRVAWTNVNGTYATHAIVPAERLVPVPEGVSAKLAAAVRSGTVKLLLRTEVREIRSDVAVLDVGGKTAFLANDDVIVRIGGEPPKAFLDRSGVRSVRKDVPVERADPQRTVA